ncbi:MAG: hypothetical protein ACJ72Q_07140 [Nitrososphaeraceae archaeon]
MISKIKNEGNLLYHFPSLSVAERESNIKNEEKLLLVHISSAIEMKNDISLVNIRP